MIKYKPTGFVVGKNAAQAPDGNLTLKLVHGFKCEGAKMMARFGNPGNIVFTSAAVGIKMNIERKTQEFFQMHEEEIISMDTHPKRTVVATS